MIEIIKVLFLFLLGFILGFGFWYLIFWFITGESNLFTWYWGVKIIYLLLSFSTTTSALNELSKI